MHTLNDGAERSCHGDYVDDARQRLKRASVTSKCISHERRQPYMARSSQSKKDFSPNGDWTSCRS